MNFIIEKYLPTKSNIFRFFSQSWRGNVSTLKVFFAYFVLGNLIVLSLVGAVYRILQSYTPEGFLLHTRAFALPIALFVIALYVLFSLLVIWRSVNSRQKHAFKWPTLFGALLTSIFYCLTLVGIALHKSILWTPAITITGRITPETYVNLKNLLNKHLFRPSRIIINSTGGDSGAALAISRLILRYNMDVEVLDFCNSSCANYIFTAGRNKYLNPHSLVIFHGGLSQSNILGLLNSQDGSSANEMIAGNVGREVVVEFNMNYKFQDQIALALEFPKFESHAEEIIYLRMLEEQHFESLGINKLIPILGQQGKYEDLYKSNKFSGFYFSLETLAALGVKNIRLRGSAWDPAKNPEFGNIYQVEYLDNSRPD